MIRVGFFIAPDDGSWLGGYNYYKNLIEAIAEFCYDIEPVIITVTESKENLQKDFPKIDIIESNILKRYSLRWIIRQVIKRIFKRDFIFERFLKKNNISILSHSGDLGGESKFPTMGWIPDFQHIHLPDLFSEQEVYERNKRFLKICENCTRVILSSEDAKSDLNKFSPEYLYKSRVLSFVVKTKIEDYISEETEFLTKFNISDKYFLLPNQFWKHKNHIIVYKAIKILKERGKSIQLVLTGNTEDYRQPGYFKELDEFAKENDITDCINVLGIVSYPDLLLLMHYSMAVLNPSLFEGWSTTVEESKSIGKRIILSDINVHREQKPYGGLYFNPNDSEQLAEVMLSVAYGQYRNDDFVLFQKANKELDERRMKFAETFSLLVKECKGQE